MGSRNSTRSQHCEWHSREKRSNWQSNLLRPHIMMIKPFCYPSLRQEHLRGGGMALPDVLGASSAGSSGDPKGKSKLSLCSYSYSRLRFRAEWQSPALRLLTTPTPQGTSGNLHHEVCTAQTSAGLAAHHALLCLCMATDTQCSLQHVLGKAHDQGKSHFGEGLVGF